MSFKSFFSLFNFRGFVVIESKIESIVLFLILHFLKNTLLLKQLLQTFEDQHEPIEVQENYHDVHED